MRAATEDDLEQIVSLQVERNGPECDAMVRALWVDPACGPRRFTVAVDGGGVVSSLCLIPGTMELAGTAVPFGQPEFVATAPSHEHRGLVRRQLDLVHRWSAEDGHLMQLIAGIPYFYRRFGYEYAIQMPPVRLVIPGVDLAMPEGWSVRPARSDDIPIIMDLERDVQSLSELSAARLATWWRWWMESGEQAVPHVAERQGVIEASASIGEGPPGMAKDVVALSLVAGRHPGRSSDAIRTASRPCSPAPPARASRWPSSSARAWPRPATPSRSDIHGAMRCTSGSRTRSSCSTTSDQCCRAASRPPLTPPTAASSCSRSTPGRWSSPTKPAK